MSHYFTNDAQLKENRREITFRFLGIEYNMVTDDGVFSKDNLDKGTEVLLKTVKKEEISGTVCDLGSGIGTIGVILSSMFKDIDMTGFDVNERAINLANENYRRYKVKGKNVLHDGVVGKFDHVISNPPIRVGKQILYRLFEEVYTSLNEEGTFIFVIRKQHGAKSAAAKCIELFGNCELLEKSKGYYIYRSKKLTN